MNQHHKLLLAATFALSSCTHSPPAADNTRTPAASGPSEGQLVRVIDPASKIDSKVPLDGEKFDVVIMGSGLSGLSAAVYLTDAGKKVLVLEKENHIGGLAAWAEGKNHIRYDRGAANWTSTYREEQEILN